MVYNGYKKFRGDNMSSFVSFILGFFSCFIGVGIVRFIDDRKKLTLGQKIIIYIVISIIVVLTAFLIYRYAMTPGTTKQIEVK